MATPYTGAVSINMDLKMGEIPSVLDFMPEEQRSAIRRETISEDLSPYITGALDAISSRGGGSLKFPAGLYTTLDFDIPTKVSIVGEGPSTKLSRFGILPDERGLINVASGSEKCAIFDLQIDGNVTTSVGLEYNTDFATVNGSNDPMAPVLVKNSSIWIHEGTKNIVLVGVKVTHTGGYAILIDAREDDISDVDLVELEIINNRPHKFGLPASGDLNYGSWTGGIHYQNDGRPGKLFAARNLRLTKSKIQRVTGVGFWGHAYGFGKMHRNVEISNNICEDTGFHGIQLGNVDGGLVIGNQVRRVGYITATDSDTPTPKYLVSSPPLYASGIDMAGLVINAVITGNSVQSANGDCFDLDGLAYSCVTGNSCIIPNPGEPGYTEDRISEIGPAGVGDNWTYGMQTGNTNMLAGGTSVVISGNYFKNMGGGAIRLYAARGCSVLNNTIEHPTSPNVGPIVLGNTVTTPSSAGRATDNVVTGNRITYNPSSAQPAIYEDPSLDAFTSADINTVFSNRIFGSAFEFRKDSNSGSNTHTILSSNDATLTGKSENFLARQGSGTSAALVVKSNNGGTIKQQIQIQDYRDGSTQDSLLNVSYDGAADTGIVSTGNRTTFGLGDVVATGKSLSYGFIAVLGESATGGTFDNTEANSFNDDWALLSFDQTTNSWKQSVSTSAGSRVWTTFGGGGGSPGGATTQIQYNNSGAFAGSSGLVWDDTLKKVTITGLTGTAGLSLLTSFISSAEGFFTASTATDAIQAASGGVTAKFLISTVSVSLIAATQAAAGTPGTGQARLIQDSADNVVKLSQNGGAYQAMAFVAGSDTHIQYNASGALGASSSLTWDNTAKVMVITGTTGTSALTILTAYINSAEGFLTASTATNAIQASNGGVTAKFLISTISVSFTAATQASAGTPGTGQARLIQDSADNIVKLSQNGGAYQAMAFVAGSDTHIQYNASGVLGASSNLTWTNGSKVMVITGNTGTSALTILTAYINSAEGFLTASSATNAIQASNGGVTAKFLISTVSVSFTAATQATAGTPGTGQARLIQDSADNVVKLSQNGGSYLPLYSGTAVSSLNSLTGAVSITAGTGVTVTPSSPNISIAIGQAVGTSSSVTFASVVSSGGVTGTAIQGTNTGTNITFQNSNFNFQVNGNGVVSSAGGYNVSGSTRIDSSGNGIFVALSASGNLTFGSSSSLIQGATTRIDSSGNAVFAGVTGTIIQGTNTGTNITFQNSNFNFQVNGNGVVSCSGGLNVSGVNRIDSSGNGRCAAYCIGAGSAIINSSGQFVGAGVAVQSNGIGGGGFSYWNGSGYNSGVTVTLDFSVYTGSMLIQGGIITST